MIRTINNMRLYGDKIVKVEELIELVGKAISENRSVTILTELSIQGFYRLESHDMNLEGRVVKKSYDGKWLMVGTDPTSHADDTYYEVSININIENPGTYKIKKVRTTSQMNKFKMENEIIDIYTLESSSRNYQGFPTHKIYFYIQTMESKIANDKRRI